MYPYIKRAIDLLASLVLTAALSPVFLLLAGLVRASSRGPAIFRQTRVGKDGRNFTIYKFRTMYLSVPRMVPTHALKGAARCITPAGKLMRRWSLDELPQLFNVLRGDMSLVGPRPALPNQTDLLAARRANGASALRPGLTGWAQINGRNEIPTALKAHYDGEYVKKIGFCFDFKCVVGTLTKRSASDAHPGNA